MAISPSVEADTAVVTLENRRGAHVWHVISRDPLAMASVVIIIVFLLIFWLTADSGQDEREIDYDAFMREIEVNHLPFGKEILQKKKKAA